MPFCHVMPPSTLNCHCAPASSPVTLTWPLLVMPSLLLRPVSLARLSVGVTPTVSTVTMALILLVPLVLPAASICLTSTFSAS